MSKTKYNDQLLFHKCSKKLAGIRNTKKLDIIVLAEDLGVVVLTVVDEFVAVVFEARVLLLLVETITDDVDAAAGDDDDDDDAAAGDADDDADVGESATVWLESDVELQSKKYKIFKFYFQ